SKKRKRNVEVIHEVFVKENIVVDAGIFLYNGNFDLVFYRRSKYALASTTQRAMKGLAECIASVSNLKRIQVKYIVKKVEDYLKTYSSTGMDII
ncbi:hypothetical protein Tco_1462381, partial [Tanacetum coccineum]